MDAWLDRIEPRVINEWMAFERLEPWGWPLIRVVIAWGRSIASLIMSALAGKPIDETKLPEVAVADEARADLPDLDEEPSEPDPDAENGDDADGQPTSEDILRAMREQDQFRF